jgi:hypothetical protein
VNSPFSEVRKLAEAATIGSWRLFSFLHQSATLNFDKLVRSEGNDAVPDDGFRGRQ